MKYSSFCFAANLFIKSVSFLILCILISIFVEGPSGVMANRVDSDIIESEFELH